MSERSKWVIDASKSEADVLEDSYARVVREFAQNVGELSLENIQKVQSLLVGHLA
jgi:dTMP kinase